jgi:hypothetical protein
MVLPEFFWVARTIMLFLKKRPTLPTKPDLSREGDFSVFVVKDAVATTEVFVPDEKAPSSSLGRGLFSRRTVDITDVVEIPPALKERDADVATEAGIQDDNRGATVRPSEACLPTSTKAVHTLHIKKHATQSGPTSEKIAQTTATPPQSWKLKLTVATRLLKKIKEKSVVGMDSRTVPKDNVQKAVPVNQHSKRKPPSLTLDIVVTEPNAEGSYWRIGATSLQQIKAADVQSAISFSSDERHFHSPIPIRDNTAQEMAVRLTGVPCSILNFSRRYHYAYVMSYAAVQETPCKIGPGLLLVHQLLLSHVKSGRATIAGLLLSDDANACASVVILYHIDVTGKVSAPTIHVDVQGLSTLLAQFAEMHQVTVDETEVILFRNKDLLERSRITRYFKETPPRVYLTKKRMEGVAVGLSGIFALSMMLPTAQQHMARVGLESTNHELAQNIATQLTSFQTVTQQRLPSFIKLLSVDTPLATMRAEQLWVPGSTVSVNASLTHQGFELAQLAAERSPPTLLGSSASPEGTAQQELATIYSVPLGCQKNESLTTGELHDIKTTFECPITDNALSKYWLD